MDTMTIIFYSAPAFCIGIVVGILLTLGILYAVKEDYKIEKEKRILK